MRRGRSQEQKLADDARLMRAWQAWYAEQLQGGARGHLRRRHAAVDGAARGSAFRTRACRLHRGAQARDWSVIDADTRAIALDEINRAIANVRERVNEKEPISDPLPDEPPNAFRMIREIIDKFPATSRKANPGVVPE